MNRTNGKIAEQSKEKIVNALLIIMKQYDYKEITITQIAQEAELSRKTFYRLFTDKEAVLSHLMEHLYLECISYLNSFQPQNYWDIVQCYFDFWESRKELLLLFKKNNLLSVLFEGAYHYSFQVFEQIRSQHIKDTYTFPLPYMLAYSVGGMHSMILRWVENDMPIPSSVLIQELKNAFKACDEI